MVVVGLDRAVGFPLPAVIYHCCLSQEPSLVSLVGSCYTRGVPRRYRPGIQYRGDTKRWFEYTARYFTSTGMARWTTVQQRGLQYSRGVLQYSRGGTTVPPNIYYSTRVLLVLYFLSQTGVTGWEIRKPCLKYGN